MKIYKTTVEKTQELAGIYCDRCGISYSGVSREDGDSFVCISLVANNKDYDICRHCIKEWIRNWPKWTKR